MEAFRRFQRLTWVLALGFASVVSAQDAAVTPETWTEQERQFVQSARALYLQQGLSFTDEQAALAVQQMRAKQKAEPVLPGVPEAEWTPLEREFVQKAREQYAAQGVGFTQAQAQLAVKTMRDRLANATGIAGAMRAMAAMPRQPAPPAGALGGQWAAGQGVGAGAAAGGGSATTEQKIAETIAGWPGKPELLAFTQRRDGFDINGVPVLDPGGRISAYAADPVGGGITYLLEAGHGVSIKSLSAGDPSRTVLLATGRRSERGWDVVTATGVTLSGQTLSVLSDGFLVGRESAAFRYQAGKGVTNIAIPAGYFLAPLQRGNVGATGFVLLEKEAATGTDSLSRLGSSLSTIGSILGANRKEDYALLDIRTRKLHPLNIPANGKMIQVHSQCRKKNWIVSECAQMQSFEALYDGYGMKNSRHYYWLIHWLNTPEGPIAITLEDGQGVLYVTELGSGRRAVAFKRSLGIADWDVLQRADGTVGVKGKLAFNWEEVPDVAVLLRSGASAGQAAASQSEPGSTTP